MASPQAREFPVAPLQPMVWPIAILLTIVLPLAITAAVVFGSQQRPLPGAAMATLLGVLLLTALVLAMLGRRRITLENGMLVVAAATCLPGPSDSDVAKATAQDLKDAQHAAARQAGAVRRELAKTTKTTAHQ